MAALPAIGSLWIGGALPQIERLCLASMAGQGHDVALYAYDPVEAPAGVTVRDAGEILPRDRIFTYKKTGSYATFADWFRLCMIARTGRVWLDADAALMRPFDVADPYFMVGGQHRIYGEMVNNCVLKAPADSALVRAALAGFDDPSQFLKYMGWSHALKLRLGRAATGKWDLSRFRWGVFGMGVLTDLVRQQGLGAYVHRDDPRVIEGPEAIFGPIAAEARDRVMIAHVFASKLRGADLPPVAPGSVYEALRARWGAA